MDSPINFISYKNLKAKNVLGIPHDFDLPTDNSDTDACSIFILENPSDPTQNTLYSFDGTNWNPIASISGGGGVGGTVDSILAFVQVGTSAAITAGINVGDTTYTNSDLAGNRAEVTYGGTDAPDFDRGDGSWFFTKTLPSTTITYSSPLQAGDLIKIKMASASISGSSYASKILASAKAGTSEATALGINVGSTTYTNSEMAGRQVEVTLNGLTMDDYDAGDGTTYFTRGSISNTYITLSSAILTGDKIKIKII